MALSILNGVESRKVIEVAVGASIEREVAGRICSEALQPKQGRDEEKSAKETKEEYAVRSEEQSLVSQKPIKKTCFKVRK